MKNVTLKAVYGFVYKGGVPNPKMHRLVLKTVNWSDGSTSEEFLPQCGTKVDVCAMEIADPTHWSWMGDTDGMCKRCQSIMHRESLKQVS